MTRPNLTPKPAERGSAGHTAGLAVHGPALAQEHACRDYAQLPLREGLVFEPGVLPDPDTLGDGPPMPFAKTAPIYPPQPRPQSQAEGPMDTIIVTGSRD